MSKHPNIIRFYGVTKLEGKLLIYSKTYAKKKILKYYIL